MTETGRGPLDVEAHEAHQDDMVILSVEMSSLVADQTSGIVTSTGNAATAAIDNSDAEAGQRILRSRRDA